jgi:hypothetical protein
MYSTRQQKIRTWQLNILQSVGRFIGLRPPFNDEGDPQFSQILTEKHNERFAGTDRYRCPMSTEFAWPSTERKSSTGIETRNSRD